MVVVKNVIPGSYADKAGIRGGYTLLSVNGNEIEDVLDYRFYIQEQRLVLAFTASGSMRSVVIRKQDEYEDIGLEFETYLMDAQRSCRNNCVFCFVDQLPKGMRDSLYFKDDDSRLSFLFGNYVTLTNMSEHEIERIIKMHISPVNISVHTMNPELRVKMLRNKNAGESLELLNKLAQANIKLNTQLVICPGMNDGEELRFSLEELGKLWPSVQSIAVVPVGLTKHRDGLCPLEAFTRENAQKTIELIEDFNAHFMYFNKCDRLAFAADELYLKAGLPVPDAEYYGEFNQLDNGVGMLALLKDEFHYALEDSEYRLTADRRIAAATGEAAYPLLCELALEAQKRYPKLHVDVIKLENGFFGSSVTVSGLLTGSDYLTLSGKLSEAEELLISRSSLRHEGDLFLDGISLEELSVRLGIEVTPVENDGDALLRAMLSE